jgi:hypothetical protein
LHKQQAVEILGRRKAVLFWQPEIKCFNMCTGDMPLAEHSGTGCFKILPHCFARWFV